MSKTNLKMAAIAWTLVCLVALGSAVQSVGGEQPREVQKRDQPKDGATLKGKIGALNADNRTVTLVISMFDRKSGQANEEEKVFTVPKDAVIIQDGVATKFENLKRGFSTTLKVNEKYATSITVEGGHVKGKFKTMNTERNTVTVIAGRDMGEKVYHLLKTTKVTLAGGKAGKVQDLQPGADIVLTLSVEGDNTIISIQPVVEEKKKRGDQ